MHFKLFYTNRLKLRLISQEVYDYIFKHYADAEIITFFALNSSAELDEEKEKYKKGFTTFNKSFLYYQLIDINTDKIIGLCGYHTWFTDHNRAEIFYKLYDDEYKQKGIMTEAIKFVINYGFHTMHLNRIEALIEPKNTASLRLAEKMGFIKEGLLREHYNNNGIMEDSVIFSLLKSESLD